VTLFFGSARSLNHPLQYGFCPFRDAHRHRQKRRLIFPLLPYLTKGIKKKARMKRQEKGRIEEDCPVSSLENDSKP
jgi:hypothetical protein